MRGFMISRTPLKPPRRRSSCLAEHGRLVEQVEHVEVEVGGELLDAARALFTRKSIECTFGRR